MGLRACACILFGDPVVRTVSALAVSDARNDRVAVFVLVVHAVVVLTEVADNHAVIFDDDSRIYTVVPFVAADACLV